MVVLVGERHGDCPNRMTLLEDVFESGGELFLAIGSTPGGASFGPRVEIVDGELVFPDEPPLDVDSEVGPEDEDSPHWDPPPPHRDSPF